MKSLKQRLIDRFTELSVRDRNAEALASICIDEINKGIKSNCPFCGEEMIGYSIVHYKCHRCDESFTN